MKKIVAIILAAGSGTRCNTEIPKQYVSVAGRPVVMWSIDAFRSAVKDVETIMVINPETEALWHDLCREHGFLSPKLVYGGATRWESVKNAITSIADCEDVTVLIHDGARPAVDAETISNVIRMAEVHDGAIPTVAVTDSLRMTKADGSSVAVDRSLYHAVQTPQGFPLDKLAKAYDLPYRSDFTDDASVMEAAGFSDLVLVDGSRNNIKLTYAADLVTLEHVLKK